MDHLIEGPTTPGTHFTTDLHKHAQNINPYLHLCLHTVSRKVSAGFGLIPVRSPLLGESLLISSPPGTEMFHFPGFAPGTHFTTDLYQNTQSINNLLLNAYATVSRKVSAGYLNITSGGLPHSEIPGSKPV